MFACAVNDWYVIEEGHKVSSDRKSIFANMEEPLHLALSGFINFIYVSVQNGIETTRWLKSSPPRPHDAG
jgi:hypothetical protein